MSLVSQRFCLSPDAIGMILALIFDYRMLLGVCESVFRLISSFVFSFKVKSRTLIHVLFIKVANVALHSRTSILLLFFDFKLFVLRNR